MDPRQYFETIVEPNFHEAKAKSDDLRLIYNAIITMNSVVEYVGLERLKYADDLDRRQLSNKVYEIRHDHGDLNDCAVTLKHVRKLNYNDSGVTATSTNILPTQRSTWVIDFDGRQLDLIAVLYMAYATLITFAELR